jgi:hypothetical protein
MRTDSMTPGIQMPRSLGDLDDKLDLLVAECAYEQWHRLLFARFLAEDNLLIHPEYRAPVTFDDCAELVESLGEPDGWSVAARFAADILPGIFRLDDPCIRLRLAPEGRLALEDLLATLSPDVFASDDALGWVYQFWQKDKKDEVNESERKIGGSDLGPVTQLFTENYMVRFLASARDHPGTTRYARCRTTCTSVNVTHHGLAAKTVGDLGKRVTATSWGSSGGRFKSCQPDDRNPL